MEKIHHTTESKYGNCIKCKKPILFAWFDKAETYGQSERVKETKYGNFHHSCTGGKSLTQLHEELKNNVNKYVEK